MKFRLVLYQLKALVPLLLITYIPTLGLLGLVVVGSFVTERPISHYTRDPAAIIGESRFIGLLSNLGVLLWCACAAICFLSFIVLIRSDKRNREWSLFLLFAGLITSMLLVDDLFLVHEWLGPYLSELIVFAIYAMVLLVFLVRFRLMIMCTAFLLLLFALGFFGLSLLFDWHLINTPETYRYLFEDGSKLLGIVSWFAYFTKTSVNMLVTKSPIKHR